MKKALLICCFLIGITKMSHAQTQIFSPEGKFVPEGRAKHLQTLLKLSDAQTGKITGYYKVLLTQMDSVVQAGGGEEDFQPLMAATKVKIKTVLTPEQNAGYEKMLKESMKQDDNEAVPPSKKKDSAAGAAPAAKQN
jgi:periplasmic protein CpxP/Spy